MVSEKRALALLFLGDDLWMLSLMFEIYPKLFLVNTIIIVLARGKAPVTPAHHQTTNLFQQMSMFSFVCLSVKEAVIYDFLLHWGLSIRRLNVQMLLVIIRGCVNGEFFSSFTEF